MNIFMVFTILFSATFHPQEFKKKKKKKKVTLTPFKGPFQRYAWHIKCEPFDTFGHNGHFIGNVPQDLFECSL